MPVTLALLLMAFPDGPPAEITPADSIANSVLGYWLSFGAVGAVAVVLFWLYILPGKQAKRIRDEARADLAAENQHLREALAKAEAQRDEAMGIATDRLVPLLANFVAVSGGLVPLLQQQASVLPSLQQVAAMVPLLQQIISRGP